MKKCNQCKKEYANSKVLFLTTSFITEGGNKMSVKSKPICWKRECTVSYYKGLMKEYLPEVLK